MTGTGGGHSVGANAAIGYGARREGLGGILTIAAGHIPEVPGFQKRIGNDYRRAKEMVDNGKGGKEDDFKDFNQGKTSDVNAKAKDYRSWYDPNGPAVIPTNSPGRLSVGECSSYVRVGLDVRPVASKLRAVPQRIAGAKIFRCIFRNIEEGWGQCAVGQR